MLSLIDNKTGDEKLWELYETSLVSFFPFYLTFFFLIGGGGGVCGEKKRGEGKGGERKRRGKQELDNINNF